MMGCPRCQNLMVEEVFVDMQADTSPSSFKGWRCIMCGAIVDSLILRHQSAPPQPIFHQTRARKPLVWMG
ncbi:MAG: hypothetical protein KF814_18500 [Nitrospiraceae bacterium]|nr:hypothetical protein [Nitrospiraceae bacterium]